MSSSNRESYFFTPRSESYQKKGSTVISSEARKSTRTSKTILTTQADCLFCASGFRRNQKQHFTGMVNKALYSKYSSSQNYYYTKDINEILAESRTGAVILFKDLLHYDEDEEYLKRFYNYSEYDFKIKMLTEYYKFHNDIARLFMMPATNVVNKYHDKKRRLEYVRVTNMLKAEQDAENPEPKPSEEKKGSKPKEYIITDRILDELDLTDAEPKIKHKRASSNLKPSQPYLGKSSTQQDSKTSAKKPTPIKYTPVIKTSTNTKPKDNGLQDRSNRDISISNTINDLNLKLGEIISNSRTHTLDINYLESSNIQPNETMSNLANFLNFMDKNPQSSRMSEIPGIANLYTKPTPKLISSIPLTSSIALTERPYRPESGLITKAKQTPRGEIVRPTDSINRMSSPTLSSKPSIKSVKTSERVKERPEDKSNTPTLLSKQASIQCLTDRPKTNVAITKIKNFDEAIKINLQSTQYKGTTHTSVPRESLQDKVLSTATTVQTARGSGTRTPYKIADVRSHESSISKKQTPLYSSTTTRPVSRSKTKSTDMYTKALDMLLGTNQIVLASSGVNTQKREPETQQLHMKTKSTFNFKLKTPSQNIMTTQTEKSSARDDGSGIVVNNKILSTKLASDRIYMQTEREVKKVGTFANLDLPKKDTVYIPLTERELPSKDYNYRTSGSKTSGKMTPVPKETENIKPSVAAFTTEQKKIGLHKYTKSEGRLKKPDGHDKVEVVSTTKALMSSTSRSKLFDQSPKRQNFTYNTNNVVNVFLNTNVERRGERTISLKTDRQPQQEGLLFHNDSDSITKLFKSRSPNADVIGKFNQSLPKKIDLNNHGIDYRNLDFSPLRTSGRDGFISNRVLSERSPPNFASTFRSKTNSKPDFEMLRRDLKFDNFDTHGRSKEKS